MYWDYELKAFLKKCVFSVFLNKDMGNNFIVNDPGAHLAAAICHHFQPMFYNFT